MSFKIQPRNSEARELTTMIRDLGTGGAGGARAPPKIEVLKSKNFQNAQNFIFHISRAPPR